MLQVRLSNKARNDLFEMESYTRLQWGVEKVTEMEIIVSNALSAIAISPYQAKYTRNSEVFVKVLSKIPFVIVYKIEKEMIFVTRFLHTKRNR